ncbi:MAG TPA: heterodisulfide reductase-related iron-sulfur binding cluster [Thermoanaerobaculia bacterium]|nr:heterodisulfide reductase-related iron-sulfur binding cluster [Thermoanaerobaculia bacterium]
MGAVGPPIAVKDATSLAAELTRIADICHGCRRCFSLCPSFDVLFKGLDLAEVDGEADKLPRRVLDDFVDLCYECKLCLPHCPYIPPHRWAVDVPHLVLESRNVRMKETGLPLRERLLSRPDALGRLARPLAPVANFVNTLPLARWAMEKALGVAAGKDLPRFVWRTFTAWFGSRVAPAFAGEPVAKVVLFPTCSVEWNRPEIGKAAVAVLEKNRVEVAVAYPRCCGMPLFDVGDIAGADEARRAFVAAMKGWVDRGYTIVTPGPSCSLMIKKEYPWLERRREEAGAPAAAGTDTQAVAKSTRDLLEFLAELKAKGLLALDFPNAPKSIAYHLPCHLKVQNIGYKSRDLLALTGAAVTMVEKCSGHDGTWAMKREYFGESMKVGKKLFDGLAAARAEVIASDCALAGVQIHQGMNVEVKHPIEVLRDAYGLP